MEEGLKLIEIYKYNLILKMMIDLNLEILNKLIINIEFYSKIFYQNV